MNTRFPHRSLAAGIAILTGLALALPAGAADFYKWVAGNGITHYSS